jgi:hypothetical protein
MPSQSAAQDGSTGGETMGLLDKAKAAAEQATTRAKEGVEEVQTKREISQIYGELGRTTYELVRSGELSHPKIAPLADKLGQLLADDDGATTDSD